MAAASALIATACAWPGNGPGCVPVGDPVPLPRGLEEASGVAVSRTHAGVYWTHGDGSAPYLYAVGAGGELRGRLHLDGIELSDFEDLAYGDCGGGLCLYLADTGDNAGRRESVRVHRLAEPDPAADGAATATTFDLRLPDGPRDVEAVFVLPGEHLYLVSKGGDGPVVVYRYPGPLRGDEVAVAEVVQRLSEGPRALPRQVTGAAATADGRLVALRTYETLTLYELAGDTLAAVPRGTVNLRTLREPQGEGVAMGDDGLIALTSEAGPLGEAGMLALIQCRL